MITARTLGALRATLDPWRGRGEQLAFVPTMGNLHDGHMQLVKQAARAADRVIVSIFVNPTQFGPKEDYAEYPRTPAEDSIKLAEAGVHVLFAPEVEEMYPHGLQQTTRVEVPGLSDILCGASRPGHFTGVATVVTKLLNIVRPTVALFGEKDYQQLMVIRTLVTDLCMNVKIIGVPTMREADGLAMSSRNTYLGGAEREKAPLLHRILCQVRDRLLEGDREYAAVEKAAAASLRKAGFKPEYVSVRRRDLAAPLAQDAELIVLAAAKLGKTRLIDNVPVSLNRAG